MWWILAIVIIVISAQVLAAYIISKVDKEGLEPTDHLREMQIEDGGPGPIEIEDKE